LSTWIAAGLLGVVLVVCHDALSDAWRLNLTAIQALRLVRLGTEAPPGDVGVLVSHPPVAGPTVERGLYLQARIHQATGHDDAAHDELTAALQHDPTDAVAAFELGMVEQQNGQTAAALQAWRLARAGPYFGRLGSDQLQAGALDAALPLLRIAAEVDPSSRTFVDLGAAQDEAMDWSAALQSYRAALVADPASTQAMERLAIDLMDHAAQPEAAATLLEQVVARAPHQSVWSYLRLGTLARERNDMEAARAWYLAAAAAFPERAEPRLALATL